MPDFWEFPTVSMGLGPIMAIYQARFNRYLEDRGLIAPEPTKVWAFLGDGETDEPESLGAITLASREKLDNLIFVINCNLQRLDGPVRGNGRSSRNWKPTSAARLERDQGDLGQRLGPLLAADTTGLLVKRMGECVDGEYQKYSRSRTAPTSASTSSASIPRLLEAGRSTSPTTSSPSCKRGGHDPEKVYAAYRAAVNHKGQPDGHPRPTIKGYGLGEAGEGKNITHQQKKLNEDELRSSAPLRHPDLRRG
jgi:pyruvate dehydrogenase E1 component